MTNKKKGTLGSNVEFDGKGFKSKTSDKKIKKLHKEVLEDIKPKEPVQVLITTRYEVEDKKCSGDYCEVLVYVNGVLAQEYGDHYHDKGDHKAKGFIDALKHIYGEEGVIITKKDINDYE